MAGTRPGADHAAGQVLMELCTTAAELEALRPAAEPLLSGTLGDAD